MKLTYDGCSQKGLVRDMNEDAYLMRSAGHAALFLVADGIGGKDHGEQVSAMLRDAYDAWFQHRILLPGTNLDFPAAVGEMKAVLLNQNREIIHRFGTMSAGSTLVLLFLLGNSYLYLSSGDSRIYQKRGLSVKQITVDDVYENWIYQKAELNPSDRGKLVAAIGIHPTPQFSLGTGTLRVGDRFFLCSDGVYRYVAPRMLRRKILLGGTPKNLVHDLSKTVERNGAGDNYSMIYVQVHTV